MFFDTHAHYDDEAFDAARHALLASLPESGVGRVVNPGCTAASSRAALDLAAQYDFLYAAVGIHPENCAGVTDADFAAVEAMAKEDKAVAIGEIGLDYYWEENPPRDFQKEVLAHFPGAESYIAPLSLSVSCHIGPGALAVAVTMRND